jgi:hypothetical protein
MEFEAAMRTAKIGGTAPSVGFLIGVALGWYFGRVVAGGKSILWEMSASAGYRQLALIPYEQADTERARQAFQAFTAFSNAMSELDSARGDEALLLETGRTYLRSLEDASLSHQ